MKLNRSLKPNKKHGDVRLYFGTPQEEQTAQNLDPKVLARMDELQAFFALFWPQSHLSELLELMGRELFTTFLTLFSGTTIQIPSAYDISRVIRMQEIYKKIGEGVPRKVLCAAYKITEVEITMIYEEMSLFYQGLQDSSDIYQKKKTIQKYKKLKESN